MTGVLTKYSGTYDQGPPNLIIQHEKRYCFGPEVVEIWYEMEGMIGCIGCLEMRKDRSGWAGRNLGGRNTPGNLMLCNISEFLGGLEVSISSSRLSCGLGFLNYHAANFSKDVFTSPTPTHNSNPSPHEEHQTHSIARPPKGDQTNKASPFPLQDLPSNRNANQSTNTNPREASRKVLAIILSSTELARADGAKRDVASRREAKQQGEDDNQPFRGRGGP